MRTRATVCKTAPLHPEKASFKEKDACNVRTVYPVCVCAANRNAAVAENSMGPLISSQVWCSGGVCTHCIVFYFHEILQNVSKRRMSKTLIKGERSTTSINDCCIWRCGEKTIYGSVGLKKKKDFYQNNKKVNLK